MEAGASDSCDYRGRLIIGILRFSIPVMTWQGDLPGARKPPFLNASIHNPRACAIVSPATMVTEGQDDLELGFTGILDPQPKFHPTGYLFIKAV